MFIVTLLEACLTFVRRRCFRALYGAGVGRFRRRPRAPAPDTAPQTTPTPALPVIIHKHYVIGPETPGDATLMVRDAGLAFASHMFSLLQLPR